MDDLDEGVHSRIRPAGTYGVYGMAGHLCERALERILHGAAGRLGLPAAERGAIVFESKGDTHGPAAARLMNKPRPEAR